MYDFLVSTGTIFGRNTKLGSVIEIWINVVNVFEIGRKETGPHQPKERETNMKCICINGRVNINTRANSIPILRDINIDNSARIFGIARPSVLRIYICNEPVTAPSNL